MGAEADNRARFTKLMTPHLSHAYRLARSLTGSQTDAEDVVQEALLKAVEALHRTEKELEERTAWALRLQEEAGTAKGQLEQVRTSRWVKFGRKVGLGPVL